MFFGLYRLNVDGGFLYSCILHRWNNVGMLGVMAVSTSCVTGFIYFESNCAPDYWNQLLFLCIFFVHVFCYLWKLQGC